MPMSVMKINTTPIVSVVMPIFKHSPAQLIRAINSILSQTLTDFEFIIIDGNPNGNNKKIIRRFADCRIKYFKTIGYINCLNLGISKSRSKYIARMESDDISYPEHLQEQVNFLEAHPDVDLCSCLVKFTGDIKPHISPYTADISLIGLIKNPCFVHAAMMFKRSLNLKYEHLKPLEDCLLFRKLLLNGKKMAIINKVLFENHISSKSLMNRHTKLIACYFAKLNAFSIAKYIGYPLSFADKIFTKHHFSKQETLEFLAFSKISQKALPNLNTTKLLAPYFHYIASHCGFNIYASFAYCQTYFTYDVKQAIKKLAKFMFTVKNERFGDKKYKVLQIFGIRIKLKAKK